MCEVIGTLITFLGFIVLTDAAIGGNPDLTILSFALVITGSFLLSH